MRTTAWIALNAGGPWALVLALGAVACADRVPAPLLIEQPSPTFRGHQDLYSSAHEPFVPWVLDRSGSIGFCLDAPPGTDTSQWEARFFTESHAAPAVRLDTTVCFEAPLPAGQAEGRARLCAELRDRFDGTVQPLPCMPFHVGADDVLLCELEKAIPVALAPRPEDPAGGSVSRLDALSERARAQGLPALALRLQLIAAYTLRREGSEPSRAGAIERLASGPSWIDLPAAARWAGQLAYERATLRLDANADLAGCWRHLREAERSFRVCADRKWIAVVAKQAEVLSRAGALAEAKARLRFALDQCASAPCDPSLVRASENTLAWLVASDPDSDTPELAAADAALTSLLAGENVPVDALEHANLLLNLAFVRERAGLEVATLLARARALLAVPASARARELTGWADLVEARHALRAGATARAQDLCDRLGTSGEGTRLRAFGLSCAASAYRLLGALDQTSDRLARAIALDESPAARVLGKDVPLGPGQRAEDVYAAARAQLEQNRPEAAWSILRALDDEAGVPSAPQALEPWLETLGELESPSSAPRREQREAIRWSTLDRMQELVRTRHELPAAGSANDDVSFRAFALEDEIVVLQRTSAGAIVLYRRTPMPRSRLVSAVRAVEDAIVRAEPDDTRWAALVEPLARALAPLPADLYAVTTFAMHGILQEVPLAALPLRSDDGAPRFLAEVTTVAWHPAGARAREPASGPRSEEAVFVLDPRGDLGVERAQDAGAFAGTGTRVLWRDGATRPAVRAALARGRWLHVDAHARYEPAFPELSTILLSDGPVTGQELCAWASSLELANLAGCETSRSPVTADSGRFGLAGLLARHGVAWVVGARAALPNALAIDFNRAFYASLADGAAIPTAYRRALDEVRARHPASRWAVLVLLHAGASRTTGQSGDPRTPLLTGGVP